MSERIREAMENLKGLLADMHDSSDDGTCRFDDPENEGCMACQCFEELSVIEDALTTSEGCVNCHHSVHEGCCTEMVTIVDDNTSWDEVCQCEGPFRNLSRAGGGP